MEDAELLLDVVGFEVDAVDVVVGAAAFDGGPFDDVAGGGAERVAEIGLLEDFFGTGASAAIGDELVSGEARVLGVVDDVEEAEFNGIGHGDAEVEVPGGTLGRTLNLELRTLNFELRRVGGDVVRGAWRVVRSCRARGWGGGQVRWSFRRSCGR